MRLLALGCLAVWPVSAWAQVRIEWRFAVDDSLVVERRFEQKQEIVAKGRTLKQESSNTWRTRFTVRARERGGWLLDASIDDVVFKSSGAENPMPFDEKVAARLKGLSLGLMLTPQGEVRKITGHDAFIKKLADGKADSEKVLRALFAEEALQEVFDEMFAFLPARPVHVGDTWKRSAVDPAPPFGSFKTRFDYVYRGVRDGQHAIDFTIASAYLKPKTEGELFKVVKGELTEEEGRGSYLFDAAAGRLVRGEKTALVRGRISIEAGGVRTDMDFRSASSLALRVVAEK